MSYSSWTRHTLARLPASLSEHALFVLWYFTSDNGNAVGYYAVPLSTIWKETRKKPEDVIRGVEELTAEGLIKYDTETDAVFIVHWYYDKRGKRIKGRKIPNPSGAKHVVFLVENNLLPVSPFYLDALRRIYDELEPWADNPHCSDDVTTCLSYIKNALATSEVINEVTSEITSAVTCEGHTQNQNQNQNRIKLRTKKDGRAEKKVKQDPCLAGARPLDDFDQDSPGEGIAVNEEDFVLALRTCQAERDRRKKSKKMTPLNSRWRRNVSVDGEDWKDLRLFRKSLERNFVEAHVLAEVLGIFKEQPIGKAELKRIGAAIAFFVDKDPAWDAQDLPARLVGW